MANSSGNTVNAALPVEHLARFAIEWGNATDDPAGESVSKWTKRVEDRQWQHLDWGDDTFEWTPKHFPAHEQARVQRWLTALIAGPTPKLIRAELEEQVAMIEGRFLVKWISEHGGPVTLTRMTGSPLALAALGVSALASPELKERFGQCEYCNRYFLDVESRRGPRGRRYCPTRNCGTSARVSRFNGRSGKRGVR